MSEPFCCRCKEDFPVGDDDGIFRMGELQKLSRAPAFIKRRYGKWINSPLHGIGYLCGNCYFDLTD